MSTPNQPGMANAQAALAALQANVATFIADSATAIQNALNSAQNPGDNDAQVQAIADGMTALSVQLANADPITNPVTIPPVTIPPITS